MKRAMRMAALGAGVAGSYLGYFLQSAFLSDAKRTYRLRSAHAKAGRRMRTEMQELRGPAMKLGQALSLHTHLLPEEVLSELSQLQMRAPGMHPSLARAQIKASLGRLPEEIFREFDLEPFAAASLGQVHRAVTPQGKAVAVKVQYPGIRDAIANDFRWFRGAALPARLSGHVPTNVIDELEQQILAEADYKREAGNLEFFRRKLAPLDYVTVPQVHRTWCSDRVLTMSLLEGLHLDGFLALGPSQRLRDTVGERLTELFYFQLLRMGALHADPHWGNYLFSKAGEIGLVDFGCVKYFKPGFVEALRKLYLYPGPRDSAEFRTLLEERYAMFGRRLSREALRALAGFSERFYGKVYPADPAAERHPFDFSDAAFLRDYVREAQAMTRAKGMLPEHIFLARAEIGLYQTLHRLKARVHTSRIVRRFLTR